MNYTVDMMNICVLFVPILLILCLVGSVISFIRLISSRRNRYIASFRLLIFLICCFVAVCLGIAVEGQRNELLYSKSKMYDIVQLDGEFLVENLEIDGKEYVKFYDGNKTVYLSDFVVIRTDDLTPQVCREYTKIGVFVVEQIIIYLPNTNLKGRETMKDYCEEYCKNICGNHNSIGCWEQFLMAKIKEKEQEQ